MRYYPIKTPAMIQWSFPRYTWKGNSEDTTIYLTIDDGPTKELTPAIREILNYYNTKATFFCVGENLHKNDDEARLLIGDGHILANHTNNHFNGWKTKTKTYIENTLACKESLEEKNINNSLFRPPYGRITRSQADRLLDLKFKIIMWDVLSGDFDPGMSPEKCLEKSVRHTQPGSIIVFHDNMKCRKNMEYALPRYIEEMNNRGYNFGLL